MIKLISYVSFFMLIFTGKAIAQPMAINNFIVKENLLKNDKIAIISTDADEKPIEQINGVFQFSINGFMQELEFRDGVAIAPQQIGKSTFIYIKHQNDNGTHAKLYYVIKKDNNLNPIKISWLLLILIPIILFVLATMFRKFILVALVLFGVMLFYNQSKGLELSTFFETVYDGIKSIF